MIMKLQIIFILSLLIVSCDSYRVLHSSILVVNDSDTPIGCVWSWESIESRLSWYIMNHSTDSDMTHILPGESNNKAISIRYPNVFDEYLKDKDTLYVSFITIKDLKNFRENLIDNFKYTSARLTLKDLEESNWIISYPYDVDTTAVYYNTIISTE